jgi:hypothetical protein
MVDFPDERTAEPCDDETAESCDVKTMESCTEPCDDGRVESCGRSCDDRVNESCGIEPVEFCCVRMSKSCGVELVESDDGVSFKPVDVDCTKLCGPDEEELMMDSNLISNT